LRAPRSHPLLSCLVLVTLVATACSGSGDPKASRATTTSSTTTSTLPPATTTTLPPTTTTTAKPPLPGLGNGASGEQVRVIEQRLSDLHYDVGSVDGKYDSATTMAVMAFQKVNGMARSGRATDDVVAAITTAGDPGPMLPGGGANRVEIDLKRQVLFVFKGGALTRILPVSTGSGKHYCVDGSCATAVTPGGSFHAGRKIRGLHISKLGKLYDPVFFNGGIAVHGSPSVPGYPASHGCVRIPMRDSVWFYDNTPTGTPVYVLGGSRAPVPFNEPAPPPDGATTTTSSTTTTAPPTSTTTTEPPSSTTSTTAPTTTTTIIP
jgi:peptidoglycan hydrolase-like protein with peptidoglycan-binding domain